MPPVAKNTATGQLAHSQVDVGAGSQGTVEFAGSRGVPGGTPEGQQLLVPDP